MYRTLKLSLVLILFTTWSFSQAPEGFPAVDKDDLSEAKLTPYRIFNGSSLYGYIDGGAELYLEYGFSGAAITEISYKGEKYKTEIYRMNDPEAAFGIFSVSKYRCISTPDVSAYSCQTRYQLSFCKGPYYVSIINSSGSSADSTNMLLIGNIIAGKISDSDVDFSRYLPDTDQVLLKTNCILAKGRIGIVNGFPDLEDFFKEISDYTALILKGDKLTISVKFNNYDSYNKFLELHDYQDALLSEKDFAAPGGERLRKISETHLYISK